MNYIDNVRDQLKNLCELKGTRDDSFSVICLVSTLVKEDNIEELSKLNALLLNSSSYIYSKISKLGFNCDIEESDIYRESDKFFDICNKIDFIRETRKAYVCELKGSIESKRLAAIIYIKELELYKEYIEINTIDVYVNIDDIYEYWNMHKLGSL